MSLTTRVLQLSLSMLVIGFNLTTGCNCPPGDSMQFIVPTHHCPPKFSKAILRQLNVQRTANNASLFTLSASISDLAQQWTSSAEPTTVYKANYSGFGQLNWLQWWHSTIVEHFYISPQDPFKLRWTPELSMPRYTGEVKRRLFRWGEWLATVQIGIGCSMTRPSGHIEDIVMFRVAVFFEYTAGVATTTKPSSEEVLTEEDIKTQKRLAHRLIN